MIRETLRRPLVALCVVPTGIVALGIIGIGLGSAITNPRTFSLGIGAVLACYGALLLGIAWLVAAGRRWALGLLVASSLLHVLVLGSFAATALGQRDWVPLAGSVAIGLVVLVALVAALLLVRQGELTAPGSD